MFRQQLAWCTDTSQRDMAKSLTILLYGRFALFFIIFAVLFVQALEASTVPLASLVIFSAVCLAALSGTLLWSAVHGEIEVLKISGVQWSQFAGPLALLLTVMTVLGCAIVQAWTSRGAALPSIATIGVSVLCATTIQLAVAWQWARVRLVLICLCVVLLHIGVGYATLYISTVPNSRWGSITLLTACALFGVIIAAIVIRERSLQKLYARANPFTAAKE